MRGVSTYSGALPNPGLLSGIQINALKKICANKNTPAYRKFIGKVERCARINGVTGTVVIPQLIDRNNGGTTETGATISATTIQSNPLLYQTAIDWYNIVKWCQSNGLDKLNNIYWVSSYKAPTGIAYSSGPPKADNTNTYYQTALSGLAAMPEGNWLKTPDPLITAQQAKGGPQPDVSLFKAAQSNFETLSKEIIQASGSIPGGGTTAPAPAPANKQNSGQQQQVVAPGISTTQILEYGGLALLAAFLLKKFA
jgi:hypothetical protein